MPPFPPAVQPAGGGAAARPLVRPCRGPWRRPTGEATQRRGIPANGVGPPLGAKPRTSITTTGSEGLLDSTRFARKAIRPATMAQARARPCQERELLAQHRDAEPRHPSAVAPVPTGGGHARTANNDLLVGVAALGVGARREARCVRCPRDGDEVPDPLDTAYRRVAREPSRRADGRTGGLWGRRVPVSRAVRRLRRGRGEARRGPEHPGGIAGNTDGRRGLRSLIAGSAPQAARVVRDMPPDTRPDLFLARPHR
jgi:hypothetical protein